MKRMHIMLRVKDLEEGVRFYSTLFDAPPTVTKPDYAKWMLPDPRVNFSISAKGENLGVEHLGIQAETPGELEELRERIGRAGGVVRNEGKTTCCYAKSDKTWVVDSNGVAWEAFYTAAASDSYYGESSLRCCEGANT